MDLDRSCLDLMIRLLELDQDQDQGSGAVADSSAQFSAREIAKMKERIRKLCDTVHNKHLDLQNITVQFTLSHTHTFPTRVYSRYYWKSYKSSGGNFSARTKNKCKLFFILSISRTVGSHDLSELQFDPRILLTCFLRLTTNGHLCQRKACSEMLS